MFNNVNKNHILQDNFKNTKIDQYDLNYKKLLTFNT